ncbi:MAG: hypothetical protein R2877_06425 [Bdellovibrionota bacterium]
MFTEGQPYIDEFREYYSKGAQPHIALWGRDQSIFSHNISSIDQHRKEMKRLGSQQVDPKITHLDKSKLTVEEYNLISQYIKSSSIYLNKNKDTFLHQATRMGMHPKSSKCSSIMVKYQYFKCLWILIVGAMD